MGGGPQLIPEVLERLDDADAAQEVDVDGGVEGGVEAHSGGGVDDGVAPGEQAPTLVVEPHAVGRDVAGDDPHPAGDLVVEAVAQLGPQAAKGVVGEDLPAGAGLRRRSAPRADEQHQLASRYRPQEPFHQGGAQKAGRAGDPDARAGQGVFDHRPFSSIIAAAGRGRGNGMEQAKDDRVLAPTRWTATLIIPVLSAAFVIFFVFPDRTKQLWAWTIHPTMTAMLMGGGYLAGAWFFLRIARSREGHRALAGLVGTTVFTTLLLLATILHWDRFNHAHVSFWAWLGLYVVTPPLLPLLWWRNRATDPGTLGRRHTTVPGPLRAVVATLGGVQLAFALAVFVHPDLALRHWPWMVTPLTLRTVAAFLSFPATAAVLVVTDKRWSSFQFPVEALTIGLVLILVATIRAEDEFGGSAAGFAALLVVTIVLLVALQAAMARRSRARALGS